jgi:hypothetical protein
LGVLIHSAIVDLQTADASQAVLPDAAAETGGAESAGRWLFGGYSANLGDHQAILLDSWDALAGFLRDEQWDSGLGEVGMEGMRREVDFTREVVVVVSAHVDDRCQKIHLKKIERLPGDQLVLYVEEFGPPQCSERAKRAKRPEQHYILQGVRIARPVAEIADAKFQKVPWPYPEPIGSVPE